MCARGVLPGLPPQLYVSLLRMLDEHGWYAISSISRLDISRVSVNPFQEVAVRLLVWGGGFVEEDAWGSRKIHEESYGGRIFSFYGWGRRFKVDAGYSLRSRGPRLDVYLDDKVLPLFVIDLGLFLEHVHPSEYLSLRSQIASSVGVIRRFLWDRHVLLTSVREGVYEWLSLLLGRAKPQYTILSTREALEVRGLSRIIVLDPSAPRTLTVRDLLWAEAFVIGGIVDRVARPGSTARLAARLGDVERRRLELRGSLHGVPNRINSIIEILLRAMYVNSGDIEKSIIDVMAKRDMRLRAYVEISRKARGKGFVDWEFYCELASWLPITVDEFRRAARMANVEVRGRWPPSCVEDARNGQQRPTSSSQAAPR